ncbi:MAG: redox-sensing transcriptional repressor Rex, partial [Kosmotogaceae bacterium]
VRKDLSYFGEFGKRGVGYGTELLLDSISEILGIRKKWNTCIVGMGNLGMALANYPGLSNSGFIAKALFDNNPNKIGIPMPNDLVIESTSLLKEIVRERNIEIGVITVPASAAQSTAELLIEAGIKGMVNFAPVRLSLPPEVRNEEIDISVSFRSLAFNMTFGSSKRGRIG